MRVERRPPNTGSVIRLALLTARYTDRLSYYDDWYDAFAGDPRFRVATVDLARAGATRRAQCALDGADVAVLLHAATADTMRYANAARRALQARAVPLLAFVGNELNLPTAPLADKLAFLKAVEPQWIATQLPLTAGQWLYRDCNRSQVIALPHALNPERFHPMVPAHQRPIDIGTRSARYNLFLGDDDRNRIVELFRRVRLDFPLRVDVGADRFDRDGWAAFLNRCKATVATEAGTSYLQRDDAIVREVQRFLRERFPGTLEIPASSPLRRAYHRLPAPVRHSIRSALGAKVVDEAGLHIEELRDEIQRRFFRSAVGEHIDGKCISSRHFDAIGTRTLQIMFPGHFNGILEADVHYLALDSDFGNLDDVLARLRDADLRDRMTRETHEYVLDNHTYRHRVDTAAAMLAT